MGQVKALFYKYWILTKRSKLGFFCQVLTPLLCLGIIKLTLYLSSNFDLPANTDANQTLPVWIYPSNLLTTKWQADYKNFYSISIPERINRWAAPTEDLKTTFESWLEKMPNSFKFETTNYRNQIDQYPQFNFAGVIPGTKFKI